MKYQLKKVVIEANEFIPEQKPWPNGVEEGACEGRNNMPKYYVPVAGGIQALVSGDFVIDHEGPAKEVVSAKDFHAKYELKEKKECSDPAKPAATKPLAKPGPRIPKH